MNHVWVRKVESRDVPLLDQWLQDTPRNLADRSVFFYPHTTVNVAFKNDRKLAFMPVQLAAVLESLAINPANTERETALALAELTKAVVMQSRERGVKEIYFVCKDESTAEFAKRQLFEELPYRTFRLKIDDLESRLQG
jgi:hypothetical protein